MSSRVGRESAGQIEQLIAPVVHEYFPATQEMQVPLDEAPTAPENVPAGHARQTLLMVAPVPVERRLDDQADMILLLQQKLRKLMSITRLGTLANKPIRISITSG